MLQFDQHGNLKPYGPIPCAIDEMEHYFADKIVSPIRREHFEKYLRYTTDLKSLLDGATLKQWINGSFVTKRPEPKDIDIVTFLSSAQIKRLGKAIEDFKLQNGQTIYGVDAYIVEEFPADHKNYSYTAGNIAYWRMQFSGTKPNRLGRKYKKGFLEINH